MKWMARARAEISKPADRGTANTDETGLLSVLAVGHSQVSGERPAADPRRAERLRRVRELLVEDPGRRYALVADPDDPGRPGEVVLAVGVRANGEVAYAELLVPADRYDALRLLDLLHQHSAQGALH